MNDWLTPLFLDLDSANSLARIDDRILKTWWPDHSNKHIHSFECWNGMDQWLDTQTPHVMKMILCVEEDWLTKSNHLCIRSKMAAHPCWSKNDLVITPSELDCELNLNLGINCLWRPCLASMIAYVPYPSHTITNDLSQINYHTSFLYHHSCPVREKICTLLQDHHAQLSVMFVPGHRINNTGQPDQCITRDETQAPLIDINIDLSWRNQTAFVTAIETMWQGPFAPYLSEKTFKAMHLLRPALIYGGYGTRDYLRQLGFDTWDWFINWQWDQMPDGPQRLDLFQQELRRLLATPISQLVDLVDSNWSRLLHNRQRLEYIIKNYKDVAFLK